jgi:glycosyltransferase involved in cell wall biosynthesis
MQLSFIVPAYNEESYIGDCLDSIIRHMSGRMREIIVVDNASTDRTAEIANSRAGVRVVYEGRKGVSYARQCGLERATGDVLAFVDADTRLSSTWADVAERELEHNRDIVCLSGPYRFYDGPVIKRWLLNVICWTSFFFAHHVFGYMVVGGNFVARREAMIQAGGFDTTIDFYGDDNDLGRRLHCRNKISFQSEFFIFTSARRFYAEGLAKTSAIYLVNFLWVFFFHRPFSASHHDVRTLYIQEKK